ncbi:MAG: hypothetical protein RL653_2442 [Pseudomonadota bacterium]|jgi:hypothetical protein
MIRPARTLDSPWDAWLQRGALAAMVGVGATLLGVGLSLYGTLP